jgi:deleted-in-malignant-brain-tumors protein 1
LIARYLNCTSFIECNDTDVRLVQLPGDMENEGRVEYCNGDRWGLVCFDSWDTNDARVICHQLGYDVESKGFL